MVKIRGYFPRYNVHNILGSMLKIMDYEYTERERQIFFDGLPMQIGSLNFRFQRR